MDMDTMVDIMDTLIMDMDMDGAERRGKLKLLLFLMLRLIPGWDIMVDTMDLDMVHTMHTLIMDMDTGESKDGRKAVIATQVFPQISKISCRSESSNKSL